MGNNGVQFPPDSFASTYKYPDRLDSRLIATQSPFRKLRIGSTGSPALDRDWVPRYFLSYILFHELLHHVIQPVHGSLHPPALLQREREFKHYERALAWEQKNIGRLLRAR